MEDAAPPDGARTGPSGAVAALTLPLDPVMVGVARAFVRERCQALGFEADLCATAVLLTSETVTNAMTHGRSEARLRVRSGTGWLVVEVADDNSRHPQQQQHDVAALDGRGLAVLGALAARWGVRDDPVGKTVWFEVRGGGRADDA